MLQSCFLFSHLPCSFLSPAQYFATIMVIVGLSLIATVIVLQFHHHDPYGDKMPKWVGRVSSSCNHLWSYFLLRSLTSGTTWAHLLHLDIVMRVSQLLVKIIFRLGLQMTIMQQRSIMNAAFLHFYIKLLYKFRYWPKSHLFCRKNNFCAPAKKLCTNKWVRCANRLIVQQQPDTIDNICSLHRGRHWRHSF